MVSGSVVEDKVTYKAGFELLMPFYSSGDSDLSLAERPVLWVFCWSLPSPQAHSFCPDARPICLPPWRP
jgi:hypothetical protein